VHQVRVTFFRDEFATNLKTAALTLPELRDRILKQTAQTKKELPWLKLASFGKSRTKDKSLRHDANVTAVEGLELDYDGKLMSFEDAVKKQREMGVRALIYTTPSHTTSAPKWRLLIPLSVSEPRTEMRAKYVARVHGYFDNIFARKETFALSQSFYYGRAKDNPDADHRVELIDGAFIDLADHLYKYQAIGEQEKEQDAKTRHGRGFEYYLKKIGDGPGLEGFNGPLTSASSSYARLHGDGFDREVLKAKLRETIDKAPKAPSRKPAELKRYLSDKYLDALIESAIEKFGHGVTVEDFVAYHPQHFYIYTPVREMWITSGVNASCPLMPACKRNGDPILDKNGQQKLEAANIWIDKNHPVQQMTWAPGEPMLICDRQITEGGDWIEKRDTTCFNLYLPPTIAHGDSNDVAPWLEHIRRTYPDDADHMIKWFAQRVQHPQIKINHALFLGGSQGIGKDSILEPVKRAVGAVNFKEVTPGNIIGRFDGYLKAVVLRINEARDLGEVNRFTFYEHLKPLTATPPDVLRVDEKNLKEHYVLNCCGVIITSNHKANGIYLPANDRRTYVAWSNCKLEDFTEEYWNRLWQWYDDGGDRNVAAYLATLDISDFNPKAPPPKTEAWWAIVNSNIASEEIELADVLQAMGNPQAVTLEQIVAAAHSGGFIDLLDWFEDRKNRRAIPHRLAECGYEPVRNPDSRKGRWQAGGRDRAIYTQTGLSLGQRVTAARLLLSQLEAEADEPKSKKSQYYQRGRF